MNLNHPSFLAPPTRSRHSSVGGPTERSELPSLESNTRRLSVAETQNLSPNLPTSDFDLLLSEKLASLDATRTVMSPFLLLAPSHNQFSPNTAGFGNPTFDPFSLPTELQGGVGNISLRRPSYAAELFTRNSDHPYPGTNQKNSLATFAAANNYSLNNTRNAFAQMSSGFENFNLNSNLSEFQARRPSQIAAPSHTFMAQSQPYYSSPSAANTPNQMGYNTHNIYGAPYQNPSQAAYNSQLPNELNVSNTMYSSQGYNQMYAPNNTNGVGNNGGNNQFVPNTQFASQHGGKLSSSVVAGQKSAKLDDGLVLREQHLEALPELRALYLSVKPYYIDPGLSSAVLMQLKQLHSNPAVQRLLAFVKNLNALSAAQKNLCLVANKNGKLDLLSYPINTNLNLKKDDLVIVDGDRGKDMVMILEPSVPLTMGILFNFLKKQEHLKSLTITDGAGKTSVKGDKNNADDNEFVVSLPTKQVLRLGAPKEVYRLSAKLQEEKKAFFTCYSKIQELGLSSVLELINVEYQSDYKKLIFYYFANFKRIDFRVLIKELFKVYKTRIWLCAVLPSDNGQLYRRDVKSLEGWCPAAHIGQNEQDQEGSRGIPPEYTIPDSYTVQTFKSMPTPTYFHLRNMLNLMANLTQDLLGSFYGFNADIIEQ